MSIGKSIDNLISTNVEIWGNAVKIKKDGKPDHTLSTSERVKIFYNIRKLNAFRSKLRWDIDSIIDKNAPNETKLNYYEGK